MKDHIKKLDKSLELLEEILANDFKDESEVEIPTLGLRLFIERTFQGLKSSQLLLNNFHINYDHAKGLIFRSIITDFFLVMNILGNAKTRDEVNLIITDYFILGEKHMKSHLKVMETSKMYSSEHLEMTRKIFTDKTSIRSHLAEKKYSKFDKPQPTTEIFNKLIKNDSLEIGYKKLITEAYDIWRLYSQYEHFTWSSYEFTRKPTQSSFIYILRFSFVIIIFCMENLGQDEKALKLSNFYKSELS